MTKEVIRQYRWSWFIWKTLFRDVGAICVRISFRKKSDSCGQVDSFCV